MNAAMLSRLGILIRREFWQSPVAFKWAPVGILVLNVVLVLFAILIGAKMDNGFQFTLEGVRAFTELPDEQKDLLVSAAMYSTGSLYHGTALIVILFYLAGCLYDDRRDRSILFWKSLPVSDTLTVASKLLTAMLAVPLAYLAVVAVNQIVLLIIASFFGWAAGIDVFRELWLSSALPQIWAVQIYAIVVQGLWLLPIYGWLMFCSAIAPRLPILIAVLVPLVISLVQHFWSLLTAFRLPDINLLAIIGKRIGRGVVPMSMEIDVSNGSIEEITRDMLISFRSVTHTLLSLEMLYGILIGALFLAGAIWFRRRAADI
ncbi:MAG: hypothetical protein Kow0020_11900 [Wenzhouxiangellaceae bacterium]